MWNLIKAAYGEYGCTAPRAVPGLPGRLDPILCARRAKVSEMKTAAIRMDAKFAVGLLDVLLDDKVLASKMNLPPGDRSSRFTNVKYLGHFKDLAHENCLLLEECKQELIKFFSTYFSVPKDDVFDRSIFNGRLLSTFTDVPPPVNLADVPRVISEMRVLADQLGVGFNVIVGDLRHWFHQLELSLESSRYFGLAINDETGAQRFFRYRGLPMGWSWSPCIAQAAAWIFLAFSEEDEIQYLDLKGLEASPMFVYIHDKAGNRIGFATIYYDNYLICCGDDSITQILNDRLKRNAAIFNIEIKVHKMWSKQSLIIKDQTDKSTATPMDFLGVEFGFTRQRGRKANGMALIWRQKKPQDPTAHGLADGPRTPREISSTVGRVIYSELLKLRGLGAISEVIDILRRVSSSAYRSSWSTRDILLSSEEKASLARGWHNVLKPQWWHGNPRAKPHEIGYVATDACDEGYGWVIFNRDGEILEISPQIKFEEHSKTSSFGSPLDAALRNHHIYLKELHGSVEGAARVKMLFPAVKLVKNVGDNTAVAGTIRRMYSVNFNAMKMLQRLEVEMEMITVPSKHNAADAPSRGWTFDEHIWELTWKAVLDDELGRKAKVPCPYGRSSGKLRHEEPADELGGPPIDFELMMIGAVEIVGIFEEHEAETTTFPAAPIK